MYTSSISNLFFKSCVISILFIFQQSFCLAQLGEKDAALKYFIKKLNISFTMPKGYSELDSTSHFDCGDGNMTNGMVYSIVNKDSSIVISFSFLTHPDAKALAMMKRFSPDFDTETNYLRTAKNQADTINHKLIFYDKVFSRKTFNADDGGEYVRNCFMPYRDKYLNHKVVFFASRGRGHAEITYFYTDKLKDKIDKFIKRTEGMLRYSD